MTSPQAAPPNNPRSAFLKGAWEGVVDPDGAWLDAYAGAWPMNRAIAALLAAGVDRALLTALVRTMQFELLMAVAQLLDDGQDRGHPDLRWRLFEIDAHGQPLRPLLALHESVLAADPTGQADREAWA